MTSEIQLPHKLISQLLNLAQKSPDVEICGLISSKNSKPFYCYPIDNVSPNSQQQFLFDVHQHISALKKMRENSEALFAIYHSHPTAIAFPSPLDLEMTNDENALHFIISLNTKGILELRAFQIKNKNATEIRIML